MMATFSLPFTPPFDWATALAHLAPRATPGVEVVDGDGYWRTLALDGRVGLIGVTGGAGALVVRSSESLGPVADVVAARVARMFDLALDPAVRAAVLDTDPLLAPTLAARPGLRVISTVDAFGHTVRAILGQQVSVRGATTLAGRLAATLGAPLPATARLDGMPAALAVTSPSAERVAEAGETTVAGIGIPRARAACLVALARAVADGTLPELAGDGSAGDHATFRERFLALPGIGPWTASYVAMRVLRDPDAFPEGDLGLRKAAGGLSAAALRARAESWRPWRAYAAQVLWASLW